MRMVCKHQKGNKFNYINIVNLIRLEIAKHPERLKDILYRIISQGGREGTKFGRNPIDILEGVYDSLTNSEMPDDRYTGSWKWTEEGFEPNPNRDWNLLFAKGNIKNQYQEIPNEEIRGYDSNSTLPTYYGNFTPKKLYVVTEEIIPLLNFLADHNFGALMLNEESGRGVISLPITEDEYRQALSEGYTVDNVGEFKPRVGRDLLGNPEMLFYDVGDFGSRYGKKYGSWDKEILSVMGELADKVGNPFILRLYVPIKVASQLELNNMSEKEIDNVYDIENALMDIALVNKVMHYAPEEDTYYGWLPEVNKFYNKK